MRGSIHLLLLWACVVGVGCLGPIKVPSLSALRGSDPALPKLKTVTLSERSDLRGKSRNICIVTTASLPWMTGTAVNPLLRAVYLARRKERHSVTLCLPWIEPSEQPHIFQKGVIYERREDLEHYIRDWVRTNLGFSTSIKIAWWEGCYLPVFGSIFPVGDPIASVPVEERDVAVLEEPEHLTWYHQGMKWCEAFSYVVGIIHTNYWSYAINDHQSSLPARVGRAYVLKTLNVWCTKSYCHRVIKLSDAVQEFPNSVTMNIHGVRNRFINIGASRVHRPWFGGMRFSKGAYFIGKALWAKGYTQLFNLLKFYREATGVNLPLDVYGSGPDLNLIKAKVVEEGLAWTFKGPLDHAHPNTHEYKIMINPSLSDVVCTTSAEALAMGKIVVCADHPSNEFFRTFPNCHIYKTDVEFCHQLAHSIASDPVPLSEDDRYRLSWEAATERFYDGSYTSSHKHRQSRVDRLLAKAHNHMASWPVLRDTGPGCGEPKKKPAEPSPKKSGEVVSLRTFAMLVVLASILKGPEIVDRVAEAVERIGGVEGAKEKMDQASGKLREMGVEARRKAERMADRKKK